MQDPALIQKLQTELIQVARKMLDQKLGVIEGSREIIRLQHDLNIDGLDPDFIPFIAIVSETDDLPVGPERQFWNQEALAAKDRLIAQAENIYRQSAVAACQAILRRFQAETDMPTQFSA